MLIRRFLALVIAASISWNPATARPTVLAVVMEAKRVHLNSVAVTTGATVCDGDQFSTETGGWLRMRSGTAMLELAEESVVSVRNRSNGVQGMEVDLARGTVTFSAARAASLNVIALEASIRPAADTSTVAQISVTGPKELRIYARRGALQFSYRGESEAVAEGKAYRVILDPPGNESEKDKKEPVNDRKKKAFLFLISEGGVVAIIYGLHEAFEYESPERP